MKKKLSILGIAALTAAIGCGEQVVSPTQLVPEAPVLALADFTSGTITIREGTCTTDQSVFVKGAVALDVCARGVVSATAASNFWMVWYRAGTPGAPLLKFQADLKSAVSGNDQVFNSVHGLSTNGLREVVLCASNPAAACLDPLPGTSSAQFIIYTHQLAFIGVPASLDPGVCSSAITVQRQTNLGAPTTHGVGTMFINLATSSSGAFYSDAGCTTPITTRSILGTGTETAAFYYKDPDSGAPTLTASENTTYHLKPAEQSLQIVTPISLTGFFPPVKDGINTVKGGSTVPLKFRVFSGETEVTSIDIVESFSLDIVNCENLTEVLGSETFVTTGGTELRYDFEAGQFVQNWKVPDTAGVCYRVTMTADGGATLVAYFKTK